MFEVPGTHPGPQANLKVFASIYFAGMRDQRAKYVRGLSRESKFVAVLPQFPRSRIELKGPKVAFGAREECGSAESPGEAMVTQMISRAPGGHNRVPLNRLAGEVD